MTLHLVQIFFTDARTFIGLPFSAVSLTAAVDGVTKASSRQLPASSSSALMQSLRNAKTLFQPPLHF